MKRILALALVAVMMLALVACGGSKTVSTPTLTYLYRTGDIRRSFRRVLRSPYKRPELFQIRQL